MHREEHKYYLCRSARIDLARYQRNYRLRQIAKKCTHIKATIIRRNEIDDATLLPMCISYVQERIGQQVIDLDRLNSILRSRLAGHYVLVQDIDANTVIGVAPLFLDEPHAAYYGFAFFNTQYLKVSIGKYMMMAAIECAKDLNLDHLVFRNLLHANSLYKTILPGFEFYDGNLWSSDRTRLVRIIAATESVDFTHMLREAEESRVGLSAVSEELFGRAQFLRGKP